MRTTLLDAGNVDIKKKKERKRKRKKNPAPTLRNSHFSWRETSEETRSTEKVTSSLEQWISVCSVGQQHRHHLLACWKWKLSHLRPTELGTLRSRAVICVFTSPLGDSDARWSVRPTGSQPWITSTGSRGTQLGSSYLTSLLFNVLINRIRMKTSLSSVEDKTTCYSINTDIIIIVHDDWSDSAQSSISIIIATIQIRTRG